MSHIRHRHALGGGGHGGGGHGGGGHGGGGHHHGGGGGGWRGGPGWWGGGTNVVYVDPYPDVMLVADSNADQYNEEWKRRAMEYILGLPKSQQKAAYAKLFPNAAVPSGVGDVTAWLASPNMGGDVWNFVTDNPVVLIGAAAAVAYLVFFRKKGGR